MRQTRLHQIFQRADRRQRGPVKGGNLASSRRFGRKKLTSAPSGWFRQAPRYTGRVVSSKQLSFGETAARLGYRLPACAAIHHKTPCPGRIGMQVRAKHHDIARLQPAERLVGAVLAGQNKTARQTQRMGRRRAHGVLAVAGTAGQHRLVRPPARLCRCWPAAGVAGGLLPAAPEGQRAFLHRRVGSGLPVAAGHLENLRWWRGPGLAGHRPLASVRAWAARCMYWMKRMNSASSVGKNPLRRGGSGLSGARPQRGGIRRPRAAGAPARRGWRLRG